MSRELLKRVIAECSDEGSRSNITTALYCEIAEYLEMPEPAEPVAWLSDRGTIWHDKQDAVDDSDGFVEPLYTTPPDQSARVAELIAQRTLQESIIKSAYTSCRELEERLATLQAKREPLSEQQILDCAESTWHRFDLDNEINFKGLVNIARAIEAAHNIGVNHE